MDYGKSGSPKQRKDAPRHAEHNAKGSTRNPFGDQSRKSELLARMKAAAGARAGADQPAADAADRDKP